MRYIFAYFYTKIMLYKINLGLKGLIKANSWWLLLRSLRKFEVPEMF